MQAHTIDWEASSLSGKAPYSLPKANNNQEALAKRFEDTISINQSEAGLSVFYLES